MNCVNKLLIAVQCMINFGHEEYLNSNFRMHQIYPQIILSRQALEKKNMILL